MSESQYITDLYELDGTGPGGRPMILILHPVQLLSGEHVLELHITSNDLKVSSEQFIFATIRVTKPDLDMFLEKVNEALSENNYEPSHWKNQPLTKEDIRV